ncbi:MAG: hypothetical protein AAF267_06230 [Deinococcota bacterium]
MDITDVIVPIIFVIISVFRVSRWIRRQSGGNRPRPSGRPTTGQSTSQQSRRPTTSSQTSGQSSQADEFRKRLEEARKRVVEAQQGSQQQGQRLGSPQPQARTTTSPTPSSADVLLPAPSRSSSGPSSSPAGGLLSPPSTQPIEGYGTSLEGKSLEGKSLEGNTVRGYGTSLESTTRAQARATLQPSSVPQQGLRVSRKRSRRIPLRFDSTSLMQGIIWREVLSEPASKHKRVAPKGYDPREHMHPKA